MKQHIYFILLLVLMCTVQVKAQQMAVVTADGTTEFSHHPYTSAKITFTNGQLLFHYNGEVTGTYKIKDINRIYFYETNAIDAVGNSRMIEYSSATEELRINAHPGMMISVFHTNGTRVLSQLQTIAASAISLSHLPTGTYVVAVGNETLKFTKR